MNLFCCPENIWTIEEPKKIGHGHYKSNPEYAIEGKVVAELYIKEQQTSLLLAPVQFFC